MSLDPQYTLERMGDLLREERKQRGESQEIFASRLGVHRSTLSRMEKGHSEVRIEAWVRAFRQMKIDLNVLQLMTRDTDLEA
ncbi:MAG: helix-turn-helix transcriptional regulator [Syntrophotalea acetylenica]|nr:helix-turn-helix transcriptional regulator [Syntrophotalea acetylenica]